MFAPDGIVMKEHYDGRLVFYVDAGHLSVKKARKYIKKMMKDRKKELKEKTNG